MVQILIFGWLFKTAPMNVDAPIILICVLVVIMPDTKHYTPHLRYKLIALLGLLFAAGFGWQLTRRFSLEVLFFLVISLALIAWAIYAMLSHVEATTNGVILFTPLRASRQIEFRQLISVSENGRFNPVLTLVYYPRETNGLLDLDDARSLILPAVTEQQELLALLEARLPI